MAQGFNTPGHFVEFVPTAPTKVTLPTTGTLGTLAGTETLTNKTLTSPTITGPTITNPTISATAPVAVTASTVTLGATHVGRTVVLNRATGIAVTLPAATGTGSIYKLFVKTTFTSAASVVRAGSDVMAGTALLFQDAANTVVGFATTNATTIDMYEASNTTGGIAGQTILLQDVDTGLWAVEIVSDAGGTEATPFS
jgi:hypothetical protein